MGHFGAIKNNIVNKELLWSVIWQGKSVIFKPQPQPVTFHLWRYQDTDAHVTRSKKGIIHYGKAPGTFNTSMTAETFLT